MYYSESSLPNVPFDIADISSAPRMCTRTRPSPGVDTERDAASETANTYTTIVLIDHVQRRSAIERSSSPFSQDVAPSRSQNREAPTGVHRRSLTAAGQEAEAAAARSGDRSNHMRLAIRWEALDAAVGTRDSGSGIECV